MSAIFAHLLLYHCYLAEIIEFQFVEPIRAQRVIMEIFVKDYRKIWWFIPPVNGYVVSSGVAAN